MDMEQLKVVVEMIKSLGEQGKEAFIWWVVADRGLPFVGNLIANLTAMATIMFVAYQGLTRLFAHKQADLTARREREKAEEQLKIERDKLQRDEFSIREMKVYATDPLIVLYLESKRYWLAHYGLLASVESAAKDPKASRAAELHRQIAEILKERGYDLKEL